MRFLPVLTAQGAQVNNRDKFKKMEKWLNIQLFQLTLSERLPIGDCRMVIVLRLSSAEKTFKEIFIVDGLDEFILEACTM